MWHAQRSSAAAEASTSDCCTSSSNSNPAPRASPTRPSATGSTRGSPPSHSPRTSHAPSAPSTWSQASPAQHPASPRPAWPPIPSSPPPTTPASFAYRPGHSALGLALVARAAAYTALSTHGTCTICDWDESDAYLRVLRQDNSRLCSRLRATWDFGPWADGFYSRLVIRVATREGFAHPFSTEEGGNQGDGFAQLHYQAPSLVITRAMRPNTSIPLPLTVPGHSASLPATHLSYSDDPRFITPSLTDVAAMATDCRECSRRAGRIIRPDKQEFSLIDSRPGRPTLVTADVPQHTGTTTTAPPEVVGIPILPELPLLRVINKSRASLDRARKASRNREVCPILQLRSLHAFGVSPLDYVTSGVLIPPPSLRPLQVAINNAYRHAFRLPPWAHSAFLHLPLQQGGPNTPLLAYRARPNLLRTYLRASWGPNTFAVAATASPVSPRRPTPWLTERPALAQALAPLDITVHLPPSPHVCPAPQHHTDSLAPLRSLPYVVVACDGSQEGTRLGAGFLLCHPRHGTLYRGWLGLHALAGHSTNAEWIAKIAAMFALRGWSGAALFASDSTASQLCDLTRAPPPSSALCIPYQAALLSASFRMHQAWLPAQHDSGSASHLATLNAEADSLARRGLRAASLWTLPRSALFHGRIVALHQGAIFLNPTRAAEAVYAATTARTHALHLRPLPRGWSSHLLRLAYERAEIPALALHRIMHLRLLHSQDHPPGYGGVRCPFCHRPYPDSAAHLQHHCPPQYALQLLLAWHLFTHPPILAATAGHSPRLVTPLELRTATTAVYLSEHLPAAPQPGPPTQLGFSLLGMWHSSSPDGAPPLLDSTGREELLRELLSTLSTTHASLASLLCRAPSHVTAPPPPPPAARPHAAQHPASHTAPQHRPSLAPSPLRHLAPHSRTPSCDPAPPGAPPGAAPGPRRVHPHVAGRGHPLAPRCHPPQASHTACANPSVLSEVLIGHTDALHVRPLLPDLHAAYAPSTPVDPSVWDSQ